MDKLKLLINKKVFEKYRNVTLGMNYLVGSLMSSSVFDVGYHDDEVDVVKGHRAMIIYLNDIKIYLDFWEYIYPTHSVQVYEQDFDIIIKLQHRLISVEDYIRGCNDKKVLSELSDAQKEELFNKVVPWTFFPSQYLLDYAEERGTTPDKLEKLPNEIMGFFCGRNWRCRRRWNGRLANKGFEIYEHRGNRIEHRPLSNDDYIHKMRTSEFGLVLPGRGSRVTEGKNRREIDYMMLRKPLVMPHTPNYHNPLLPNKHYICINRHTDYTQLHKKYDLEKMTEDAYQWYVDNASPYGVVKTFLEIAQGIRPTHPDYNPSMYRIS